MADRVPSLERRVTKVESAVEAMPDRIAKAIAEVKDFFHEELQELKADHLTGIRQTIERVERDLKGENARLADDQRRMWDAVRKLEDDRNRQVGVRGATSTLRQTLIGLSSGGIGAVIGWLLHFAAH